MALRRGLILVGALVGLACAGSDGEPGASDDSPQGDTPDTALIRQSLDSLRSLYGFPGIVASWTTTAGRRGPERLGDSATIAVGVADPGTGEPLSPEARMLAGSIGKSFVAATVLALAGEGSLSLDDRLAKWLGDRPWFAELPNGPDITLRHLLTHGSGLSDHVYDPGFQAAWALRRQQPGPPFQPAELVGFILNTPALFPAGQGWAYTDTGYILLGLAAEAAAGKELFSMIEGRFLRPLSLARTEPSDRRELRDLAPGWVDPANPFGLPRATLQAPDRLAWDPSLEGAGGGLVSHPADLVRWAVALFSGAAMPTPYLEEIERGVPIDGPDGVLEYGAGIAIRRGGSFGPVLGHAGYVPGYLSSLRHYPRFGVTVAFQVNTDGPFSGGVDSGEVMAALEATLARHLMAEDGA